LDGESVTEKKAAEQGILSGIVVAAATMALRSVTSMLFQHLSQSLMGTRKLAANDNETPIPQQTNPSQHERFTS